MRISGLWGYVLPWAGWRYWRERLKLTAKAVLAGVVAWAAARYAVGHSEPYFAPLAALLGVYPSVVRSVRESLAYGAGFVIGAALAIPVGLWIGPNIAGIAVVLFLAMMASGWRRLGGQASQVPFTALFALLLGGHDAVGYTLPRLGDVALGLAVGLAVNALVFPPLHLRRAEYAVERMRDVLAEAMDAESEELRFSEAFRHDHARVIGMLAGLVRRLPEAPGEEELADAERLQCHLERPHNGAGTDAPGLWDPQKEVLRLSRLMLDDLRPRPPR